jgi:hypothetical protein
MTAAKDHSWIRKRVRRSGCITPSVNTPLTSLGKGSKNKTGTGNIPRVCWSMRHVVCNQPATVKHFPFQCFKVPWLYSLVFLITFKWESMWSTLELQWRGKTAVLGEKPVSVSVSLPQTSCGLSWDRARASPVKDRRLTACTMVWPWKPTLVLTENNVVIVHWGIADTQRRHSFLTLALHEGQLSAFDPGRFTHRKRTPGTLRTGCGVGPAIGEGIFDKEEHPLSLLEFERHSCKSYTKQFVRHREHGPYHWETNRLMVFRGTNRYLLVHPQETHKVHCVGENARFLMSSR